MPEQFDIEEVYQITPVRPHPIVKIWKNKKEKKRRLQDYKKRKKTRKKGHIDIYV